MHNATLSSYVSSSTLLLEAQRVLETVDSVAVLLEEMAENILVGQSWRLACLSSLVSSCVLIKSTACLDDWLEATKLSVDD